MMKYTVLILSLLFSVAGFGQGQMFLRATAAGGGPANLLLDDYPGAAAAYAVMKLDNDYAGSCIRIRRDSDSAEQDIGFSGNDIDEASINSFCSGANCFIKTWYDQSGNGNNMTQTTAANQPKIHDSSTGIIYDNSIASISFDGSDDQFNFTSTITTSSYYDFWVANTSDTDYIPTIAVAGNKIGWIIQFGSSSGSLYADWGSPSLYVNGVIQSLSTRNALYNSLNGRKLGHTSAANQTNWTNSYQFSAYGGAYKWAAKISLFVVYSSVPNRAGVESAINNYFNIY